MDYLLQGFLQGFVLLFTGNAEAYSAIWATVYASTLSMTCGMSLGVPLGFLLGYKSFPGKKVVRTIVDTLLSFPTVVIGLLVYAFLTRNGPLGGSGLLFSIPGVALGQTLLGLPIIIAMTATAVEALDRRLPMTLITLGATPRQMMWATVLEARYSIMLAAMSAYGRIVSEVGISMMVGGNIKWHTRTITTAIALETGKGEFAVGIALGMVLLTVALLVNIGAAGLKKRAVQ
ncbi:MULTISPECIES: ABC transporter permease [unclassified Pseudodesulfovibrio]|jgi:tungstate transport system permease protein|uniref:ABC transporter permease n=1 Tax=unclassified Pseudodesulfovibrio TaxID=2661612 RepID=UPI000FEB8F79|nr:MULTISPECIES: ABC transporter permease [unclassified Pseudodesulfovibrio]MCJ2164067.1 ABC transporter permease [Pseudodesulfovibrio sp. S3-i]RWU05300.1 ABC transporter permease subunit [Pseudodesulfovibrio sp. S3]